MRIIVASANRAKIVGTMRAVEAVLPGKHRVEGLPFPGPLPDMPRGEAVFDGARLRARWAWDMGAHLGVGIESGLLRLPGMPEEFLATVACVMGEDGEGWGMSASFPFRFHGGPPDPVRGHVDRLTEGKMVRADLVYQAVLLALYSRIRGKKR